MRNLKRALSLALASIMVLGMMVVGAGAVSYDDLSDKDKIVNQEAVQMLVELGVINGKEDGSYDPTGIVTRAEMAKMICVVLNGGKDPNLGTTVTNSYTDTAGTWAAGYIEYCTQLGIVAGDGAGRFNPNDTVTGSEAAKMLLVALGYKSEVEGFTGANWAIATNVRANQKGLYKDLSINANEGLTRDSAAQMVYNALDADVVYYDYTLVTNGSTISSSPTLHDDTNKSLLEDKFNAVKVEGVVIANEFADLKSGSSKGSSLDEGKTQIRVTNGGANEDQNEYVGDKTFAVDSTMEQLGRSVVVYVKKNSNSTKAEVLGSVITSGDNKVVVDTSTDSVNDVADDNKLDIDTKTTKIVTNYGDMGTITKDQAAAARIAGVEKVLIDTDDDGTVDYVLVNTYYFGKVTTYSTSGDGSIAVDVGATQAAVGKDITKLTADDKADVTGFDDVSKGDYVLAQYIGGKLVVEKAESVTGTLEAYKDTAPTTKVTVDGTDYNVSNVTGYVGGDDDIRQASTDAKDSVKSEATFYLDKNGRVAAMGEVDANAGKYAMVLAKGSDINDKVKVALADGSIGTYDINDSGSGKSKGELNIGQVYAYSISSNSKIKLTEVTMAQGSDSAADANAKFSKGKITVKSDGGTYYATKNTAFFYVTNGSNDIIDDDNSIANADVETYASYEKAPNLPDSGVSAYIYTKGTGSNEKLVAVVFVGSNLVKADVSDNLYVTKIVSTDGDDTKVEAFINGSDKVQSITVTGTDVEVRHTYTYSVNSDGTYDLETDYVQDPAVTISRVTGRNFVVGGEALKITSDTLVVDHSKYLDSPTATLGTGATVSKGDVVIGLVVNSDGEALMVVIRNEKTTSGGSSSGSGDFNVEGEETGRGTSAADLSEKLEEGNVIVSGSYAPKSGDLTVPKNTTLKIEGDFDATKLDSVNVEKGGKIVVDGTYTTDMDLYEDVTAVNVVITANVEADGEVIVTEDLTVADGKTLTVTGTVTVEGNITGNTDGTGTIIVKSSNSLHVDGNVAANITVGTSSAAGKVVINGNLTGDVDVANGTLTVNGVLDADTVTGTAKGSIIFGDDASEDGDAVFYDGKLAEIEDVAGKTFTWNGSAFVTEVLSVKAIKVVGSDGSTAVTAPKAGDTLTANVELSDGSIIGSYPANEFVNYKWIVGDDTELGTDATQVVTEDNIGKTISCTVTIDGMKGSATWTSSEVVAAADSE